MYMINLRLFMIRGTGQRRGNCYVLGFHRIAHQTIFLFWYSMSTNFRLELIEPSSKEVFIFGRVKRAGGGGSDLPRFEEAASELKNCWPSSKRKRKTLWAQGERVTLTDIIIIIIYCRYRENWWFLGFIWWHGDNGNVSTNLSEAEFRPGHG